jgi:hypothetical protein
MIASLHWVISASSSAQTLPPKALRAVLFANARLSDKCPGRLAALEAGFREPACVAVA